MYKLARLGYYKYRAANLMFGFNTHVTSRLTSFSEFNALRKNQLLAFYDQIAPLLRGCLLGWDPNPDPNPYPNPNPNPHVHPEPTLTPKQVRGRAAHEH